jgi:hypothetical protein
LKSNFNNIFFSTSQEPYQATPSAPIRCPASCAQDTFFALAKYICPRRVTNYIFLRETLRRVEHAYLKKKEWGKKHEQLCLDLRTESRELRCTEFLNFLQREKYITVLHEGIIGEPKRQNFEKELREGQKKLKGEGGLLVYVYTQNDGGTIFKHCLEMQVSKHPERKDIVLIDNQKHEPVSLERFPVSGLIKIQVVRIVPKQLKYLRKYFGKHLCAHEIHHPGGN